MNSSEKRTPVTPGSRSRQEEWMLPEFIGIGHTLEQAKLLRKETYDKYLQVSNRVTFFEKEYSRTSKSIDNNKKALSKIIEIRSRRNSDQNEKESYRRRLKEREDHAKMQATYIKEQNKNGLVEAMKQRNMRIHEASQEVKELLKREFSWKREFDVLQMQWMNVPDFIRQDNYNEIQQNKIKGRQRVNAYRSEKNSKALKSYSDRIANEKKTTEMLEREISKLTAQEMAVLSKLKDSAAQEEALRTTINKANQLDLLKLEQKLRSPRTLSVDAPKFGANNSSELFAHDKSAELSPAKQLLSGTGDSLNPQRGYVSCSCKKSDCGRVLSNSQGKPTRYRRRRNHRKRKLIELF